MRNDLQMSAPTSTAVVGKPGTHDLAKAQNPISQTPASQTPVLQLGPLARDALFRSALAHLDRGSRSRALAVARALHALEPDDAKLRLLLCACLLAERRYDQAASALEALRDTRQSREHAIVVGARLIRGAIEWHRGCAAAVGAGAQQGVPAR